MIDVNKICEVKGNVAMVLEENTLYAYNLICSIDVKDLYINSRSKAIVAKNKNQAFEKL